MPERFEQESWYPWRERKSFSSFQVSDLKTLLGHLKEIPRYFDGILSQLRELSAADLTFEECEALVIRKKEAEEMVELLGTEQRFKTFQAIVYEPEEETSSLWLAISSASSPIAIRAMDLKSPYPRIISGN